MTTRLAWPSRGSTVAQGKQLWQRQTFSSKKMGSSDVGGNMVPLVAAVIAVMETLSRTVLVKKQASAHTHFWPYNERQLVPAHHEDAPFCGQRDCDRPQGSSKAKVERIWPLFSCLGEWFCEACVSERDISVDESLMLFEKKLQMGTAHFTQIDPVWTKSFYCARKHWKKCGTR